MNVWRAFWSWYFQPKAFEKTGRCRIYRYLGIRLFKYYLPTSGDLVSRWFGVRRITLLKSMRMDSLLRHERFTRSYEARHLLGAVTMLAISYYAISVRQNGNWFYLSCANLLINGYPIFLQRYNRIRIQALLQRLAPSKLHKL